MGLDLRVGGGIEHLTVLIMSNGHQKGNILVFTALHGTHFLHLHFVHYTHITPMFWGHC